MKMIGIYVCSKLSLSMITVSLLQFVSLISVEGGTVSLGLFFIYPPNHKYVQIYHVNLCSSFVQVILGSARRKKIMLKG